VAGVLEQIAAVQLQRAPVHPNQGRVDMARDAGSRMGRGDEVAATDVEFAIEHQRYRKRSMRFRQVAIEGDDARNLCGAA